MHTYAKHSQGVAACAWLADGRHFVSAGSDKNIFLWNVGGEIVQTWHGLRVADLVVSRAGKQLITINAQKIRVCDLLIDGKGAPYIETSKEHVMEELDSITSLSLSSDSRHVLVNLASGDIHAWDLQDKLLLHKYRAQKRGRYIIRSSFGGVNEAFVVSGYEDSQVYVWHRHNMALLQVLAGHSGTVNAVAWNPRDPHMFASCSDDQTVRIWVLPFLS